MAKKGLTYKDAGVDIDTGNELAKVYLNQMKSTFGPQVLNNDGGFAGLYSLKGAPGLFSKGEGESDPLLVSATDGVGTKLKIAFEMDKHDTVGIDLVAMSVNDILVQGAEPLLFLDYVASGHIEKKTTVDIVSGVAEGCRRAGCALLGGETAELPGFYAAGEYDLAGFAVGVVERSRVITGENVCAGDVIIGMPSAGLHSNGYSLARKALLEAGALKLEENISELGCTLGEELLKPTNIYVKELVPVLREKGAEKPIKALAHITGGGLYENVPRVLPDSCDAEFDRGSWKVPPIFDLIAKCGDVEDREMHRVFNMGVGMVVVVDKANADEVMNIMRGAGSDCSVIGRVTEGSGPGKVSLI